MASVFLLNDFALPPVFRGLEEIFQQLSPWTTVFLTALVLVAGMGMLSLLTQGHRLREKRRSDAEFMEHFQLSEHPLALYLSRRSQPASPCFRAYESGCRELCLHLIGSSTINAELPHRLRTAGRISPSQMNAVERALGHAGETGLSSLRPETGWLTLLLLPVLGMAGTLTVWMEESWKLRPFSLYPALLPLAFALILMLPLLVWRARHEMAIADANRRLRHLAAIWTREVNRIFVDHRQPLDTLPSLDYMEVIEKPTFSQSPADG